MAIVRLFTFTSPDSPTTTSGGTMEIIGLPGPTPNSMTVDGDVLTLKGTSPVSRVVYHVEDLKLTLSGGINVQDGTITSITYNVFGQKLGQITGLKLDAADYFNPMFTGDAETAYTLLLAGADKIYGTNLTDSMIGLGGNDSLFGYGAGDDMDGEAGRDVLYGGSGKDEIEGGNGNDKLFGGAGTDSLYGQAGRDQLTGGGGADEFVFERTPLSGANADVITDFALGIDKIALYGFNFGGLVSGGALAATAFKVGSGATTASHRIIYEKSSGKIFYDADGNGAGGAVLFAQIDAGLALKAADFVIFS